MSKRPWTTDELMMLVDNGSLGSHALAKMLGRTPRAVNSAAHRLGVSVRSADPADHVTRGKFWAAADDAALADNAHLGYKRVAELLSRTPGATRERARVLKVSLRRREVTVVS